jgi:hypothetical protein
MKKKILSAVILASLGPVGSIGAQAAILNNGDVLHITPAVTAYDSNGNYAGVTAGSYYGVDFDGNGAITNGPISTVEKVALSEGTTGLVIGVTSTPGASHGGCPVASDTNAVTAPDCFLGNTGSWYFTSPVFGSTTNGLDMSGWNWSWNGNPSIPLGSLAWQPTNCVDLGCAGYTFTDGIGLFQWDGVYGHAYTLDFTSTGVHGDPTGFGDVRFYTHLEGVVEAAPVPVPAAMWLFGSGLVGLLGLARRNRKKV